MFWVQLSAILCTGISISASTFGNKIAMLARKKLFLGGYPLSSRNASEVSLNISRLLEKSFSRMLLFTSRTFSNTGYFYKAMNLSFNILLSAG